MAERLVAAGALVVVADIGEAGAQVVEEFGECAEFVQTDVSNAAQVERLIAATVKRFGRLDVVCNVAGVSGGLRRFLDDDLRDFERVIAVDLLGVLLTTQAAARHMAAHGGGAIVNVASGAGVTPGVGMLPYRVAKAGVAHATRCLAVELGAHGIRVNAVAPANIATDINAAFDKATVTSLQPLPHQGVAADVADASVHPPRPASGPHHRRRPVHRRRHGVRHAPTPRPEPWRFDDRRGTERHTSTAAGGVHAMTVTHTTGTESTDTIDTNVTVRAGDWVDTGPGLDDLIGNYRMQIPTDRYVSADYAAREREAVWMRTWQVAGRLDEIPDSGDWKQYSIYDQSFLIVRGRDASCAASSTPADIAATCCVATTPETPPASSAPITSGPTT